MATDDDEDALERTMTSEEGPIVDATGNIFALLDEVEGLLKNGLIVGALSTKNINASLCLCAIQGLRAYLGGRKIEAADDFTTVAEEIRARLAASSSEGSGRGRA